jgi:pimeloyl-ACP methyl ester carboxylesterase
LNTFILTAIFSLFFLVGFSQTPPLQSTTGPGSSDYTHSDVIMSDFTSIWSADGYWLFEPDSPKPDSADVVVFNHGYGVYNPGPYGQWIEHLVRNGNIVIFPKYQLNEASLPSTYTPNAVTGIQDAFLEMSINSNRVKPRMEHFAIIGHSYGGVITSNLVTEYNAYGIPQPQCFMLCQPGTGGLNSGRLNSYVAMDTSYNALIVVGSGDIVVGNTFGREIMDSTTIPTAHKNYITHYPDNTGNPNIQATHNEPLAANTDYDGGPISTVITAGYVASKIDAVDFYCYWKLADALLNCTFYNQDCNYAFGDTPEQKYMGQWSDGTVVEELVVEPQNTVSIAEHNWLDITAGPNPAENLLTLLTDEKLNSIILFDLQGKEIAKFDASMRALDISKIASGTYLLAVQASEKRVSIKIMIK